MVAEAMPTIARLESVDGPIAGRPKTAQLYCHSCAALMGELCRDARGCQKTRKAITQRVARIGADQWFREGEYPPPKTRVV